jgi:thiol-disulfide isomerase/thioredoxin
LAALLCAGVAAAADVDQTKPFNIETVEPPQPAPDLGFLDRAGHETSLANFRGRVVVLNLWATWCLPCIAEMPSLDRLAARLADAPFSVVAVALDREGKRPVDAFYRRAGIAALPQYFDPRGRLAKDVGAAGLPMTLVIDHEGREIGRLSGSNDWSSPAALDYLMPLIGRARSPSPAGG